MGRSKPRPLVSSSATGQKAPYGGLQALWRDPACRPLPSAKAQNVKHISPKKVDNRIPSCMMETMATCLPIRTLAAAERQAALWNANQTPAELARGTKPCPAK